MDKPAGSGEHDGTKLARGFLKVKSVFSSKSGSKTSTLPSTATINRTEVVGGLPIRSAGTNTVLDSFSPTASAAPSTLPLGDTSPAVDAIASGAAVPSSGTIPGSDEPLPNAVGNPSILQIAPAKTANGPVTAPGVNSTSTDGQIAPLRLWLRAKNAPIWNQALQTLKQENPEMHKELEELEKNKNGLRDFHERKLDELFRLDTAKPQEKAVVQRLKQCLPSLVAVRGIAMTAAALDPHKIAPIVCACVFFSIDLALNKLSPEDKQKMRNFVFESVIAINEWISFESNFQNKSHDAIQDEVKELEVLLTGQYLQALRLLCDILLSQNGSWTKRAGEKLTNKIVEYDLRLTVLKDHKSIWTSKKKLVEETLAGEEDIGKVLKWIQQDGDPEESLREIGSRVTSDGRYPNCAEWILRGKEFQDWSRYWFSEGKQRPSKRMMWVNGPYGTGKTTIIYRMVSELQALSENYLRRELRVIPYFCTARSDESKRADYYSIIIRALARKVSLMPDFTLAQRAVAFHSQHTRGLQEGVNIPLWEEFLRDLLRDVKGVSDFVFVIDALDECDPVEEPVNSEKLLEFMRDLMQKFPNIQVLCSSRQHVPVGKYIPDALLYQADALSAPNNEIQSFIRSEIDSRRKKQQGSVFFKAGCEDIRKRLEQSLIDHAKGMYEWVNIWLKLTIPIHNTRDTVRWSEDAEEMLKAIEDSSRETNDAYDKLRAGYLRLWELGALKGFDEIRICLFRLILCSFEPLSVGHLTCLLRHWIGSDRLYDRLPVEEVESLYSNFLVSEVVSQDLRFTHSSAREFVMTEILGKTIGGPRESLAALIMKENHRSIAKLFMDFLQRSDKRYRSEVLVDFELLYFKKFGLRHCEYAAEKQSIFDKVWTDMIQRVLRPLESRSDNITSALKVLGFHDYPYNHGEISRFIFQKREGKSHLLFSHALVWLGIIHDDDVNDIQPWDLRTAPSDTGTREGILRHFAERAASKSTGQDANALHIACLKRSAAAAMLVLKSSYYLYGKDACTDLLSSQSISGTEWQTPFVVSLTTYSMLPQAANIPIMEALLWFESRYLNTAGEKEKAISSQKPPRAQQWSHVCDMYWNALWFAVSKCDEDIVCRLLKIAGPVAINELDQHGYTPVMAAISWGRLKIMRTLVENCHADLSVKGLGGKTVLDIARKRYPHEADYLEKKMSDSEPGKLVDSSSKVNENTS